MASPSLRRGLGREDEGGSFPPLVSQSPAPAAIAPEAVQVTLPPPTKAPKTFKPYYLATILMSAAFMQGYDSGVAGGVLTFPSFQHDFSYTPAEKTRVNSLSVGLLCAGCAVAAVGLAFTGCFAGGAEGGRGRSGGPRCAAGGGGRRGVKGVRWGRKPIVLVSAAVFALGVLLELVGACPGVARGKRLAVWYLGRFVAGLGQGGCSVTIPIYASEMSPPAIRSRIGSMYQWFYTLGIFTSYWGDYGVARGIAKTSAAQWRIPVGVQLIPAGVLFVGMLTLKESVRVLVRDGRLEEAWASLLWIRGEDGACVSEETRAEWEGIITGLRAEEVAREGLRVREVVLEPANRRRMSIAVLIFVFQQGTGATALAYFGPQFFQLVVNTSPSSGGADKALLLTGLFGAVKVAACTIFVFLLAERFGRRAFFVAGGAFMGACMLATACVYHTRVEHAKDKDSAASAAVVALLYLMVAAYNWSWGTLPFVYVPEMFPMRTREVGVAVAVAEHWVLSFAFSIATPYMLRDLGWGTFLFYGCFDVAMALFAFFFLEETKGKTLESMDHLFRSKGDVVRDQKVVEEELEVVD